MKLPRPTVSVSTNTGAGERDQCVSDRELVS